jgi:hypothetical protein
VAEWSTSFEDFAFHVRDFLHHFQASPAMDGLMEAPALLAERFAQGQIADAYLAAVAVELAHHLRQPRPAWTQAPERFCRLPWFASHGPHMRATLLLESPPGFRERNLFVSSNALSVA